MRCFGCQGSCFSVAKLNPIALYAAPYSVRGTTIGATMPATSCSNYQSFMLLTKFELSPAEGLTDLNHKWMNRPAIHVDVAEHPHGAGQGEAQQCSVVHLDVKPCFGREPPQASSRQHDAIAIAIAIVMLFFLPRLCQVPMYISVPVNTWTFFRFLASLQR